MSKQKYPLKSFCCFKYDTDFSLSESEIMKDINYPFESDRHQTNLKQQPQAREHRNADANYYPDAVSQL